jgi:hypothetical protein
MIAKWPILLGASVLALCCTVHGVSAAANLGEKCDIAARVRCAPGQWCDRDPGQCGTAEGRGTCVRVRQLCFQLYRPVCGCNGNTYSNDCHRIRARVAKKHDGKC